MSTITRGGGLGRWQTRGGGWRARGSRGNGLIISTRGGGFDRWQTRGGCLGGWRTRGSRGGRVSRITRGSGWHTQGSGRGGWRTRGEGRGGWNNRGVWLLAHFIGCDARGSTVDRSGVCTGHGEESRDNNTNDLESQHVVYWKALQ